MFNLMHHDGHMTSDAELAALPALLAELELADDEHPDVAVNHESEWSLSTSRGGYVCFENLEAEDTSTARHMAGVDSPTVLRLMELVALGRFEELETFPWQPGY
jgi:hypothetical protein